MARDIAEEIFFLPSFWETTAETFQELLWFGVEVGRFLKIRNCELGFLLPLSQMRNCEPENDSFFDSFPIPLDYDSGSNSIKITKNGQ